MRRSSSGGISTPSRDFLLHVNGSTARLQGPPGKPKYEDLFGRCWAGGKGVDCWLTSTAAPSEAKHRMGLGCAFKVPLAHKTLAHITLAPSLCVWLAHSHSSFSPEPPEQPSSPEPTLLSIWALAKNVALFLNLNLILDLLPRGVDLFEAFLFISFTFRHFSFRADSVVVAHQPKQQHTFCKMRSWIFARGCGAGVGVGMVASS